MIPPLSFVLSKIGKKKKKKNRRTICITSKFDKHDSLKKIKIILLES